MQTINSLFAASVERFANRASLIEPAGGAKEETMSVLTYRELQERTKGFAGYLQHLQIKKSDCLLIWSPSRTDWLIAYFGALVVGAVVVPLDVNSKEDFPIRVAETTNARLLISTQKQFAGLKHVSLPLVDIDALPQEPLDNTKLPVVNEENNLYLKGRKKNLIVLTNGLNVYPEDIENVLQANPLVKDAAVFGLMENGQGPEVHAVLLMDNPDNAKSVIQQSNKQLASHQQIRRFTVWPETDFPRTHTLKVKRLDVLNKLEKIRTAENGSQRKVE